MRYVVGLAGGIGCGKSKAADFFEALGADVIDTDARGRLEAILHPLIRAKSLARIEASRAPDVVLVVPLLLETDGYRDVLARVLVVDCEESQQVARVASPSNLGAEEIGRIMRAQLSRAERVRRADDVLVNDASIDDLRLKVGKLHSQYLDAAAAGGG